MCVDICRQDMFLSILQDLFTIVSHGFEDVQLNISTCVFSQELFSNMYPAEKIHETSWNFMKVDEKSPLISWKCTMLNWHKHRVGQLMKFHELFREIWWKLSTTPCQRSSWWILMNNVVHQKCVILTWRTFMKKWLIVTHCAWRSRLGSQRIVGSIPIPVN